MSIIESSNLSKHYGSTKALDKLELKLEAGEPIALVGPNGAGKTTFLSLLCGFIRLSGGEVKVLGHEPGSQALSGRMSALPQDARFDPTLSVGRQLKLYAQLQGLSSDQATKEVSRVLDVVRLPEVINDKSESLSHGMRKRVALAQALLGSPELILLDEPTAGIDPPNVKIIRDLIREQASNATFIISSHNLDELEKLCTSVVYLENGKLVQMGPIDASDDVDYLTIRIPGVDEEPFVEACLQLPGVVKVLRQSQGDFLIECSEDVAVDQALLAMLAERGWPYRHLAKGRSLEARLYG
ncbi:MAG: ABC transporter ATP-binding protein [Granulosicoccaceae bacterium]